MDLSTKYLGLDLPHPLICGSSPFTRDIDRAKRAEDGGAAAIVAHSLFEEQIVAEQNLAVEHVDSHVESFAEARSYLPDPSDFHIGPDDYLKLIANMKSSLNIPVIGSLNGNTLGGWLDHARLIEQAGADAIELNAYLVATDPDTSASDMEATKIEMVREVKKHVRIPVAVKLSPFYTSLPHFASQLAEAGADGLVLFNRFYQPDFDVEQLEVVRTLHLSNPEHLLLRLHGIACISGRVNVSLSLTGGVHDTLDAVKAVMAGAQTVQIVSALLLKGPNHLNYILRGLRTWLELHEYESLKQACGSMSYVKCPDPRAFERLNYMKILQSWQS